MDRSYYVTTPIYYISGNPHIGHAYTTVVADVLARTARTSGPAFFLTGTDEHGQKVANAAAEHGKTPQAWCDELVPRWQSLFAAYHVEYDDFIRTTQPRHETKVQRVFERLRESGDVYLGKYEGWYCVSDETFFTETEAPEDDKGRRLCPNAECRKPLQRVEEESWFFKLSKYQEPLLKHYAAHPDFLAPAHRANEILRFVEGGLQDLSVSRQKVKWGIPVPGDESHTIYVWFDALINYWSAAAGTDDLWPADVHIVGKEIYRFHAVIWPAMLMAAGLPLPRQVFAHGWWTAEGKKMSKSAGNFVDPYEVTREYGTDVFRFFLLRQMQFGNDGDFSADALRNRYNSELVDGLSNLLYRIETMVDSYLDGRMPVKGSPSDDFHLTHVAPRAPEISAKIDALDFHGALEVIWEVIRSLNERVAKTEPFKLAKTDKVKCELVLFDMIHSLRIVAGWIEPFMPRKAAEMHLQLGVRQFPEALTADDVLTGANSHPGRIQKGPPLFMRKK